MTETRFDVSGLHCGLNQLVKHLVVLIAVSSRIAEIVVVDFDKARGKRPIGKIMSLLSKALRG